MKKKIVLITGATAGIGKACAFMFAENNFNVILTGRRKELLESIASDIREKTIADVCTLNFDVRNKTDVLNSIHSLPEKWKKIDVLINNAGLALGLTPIQSGDPDDWDVMIDTNIKGLLYVTHAVLPWMVERKNGHIINIGSIAGKEAYANGNVYCATKAAVDALSKGMRIDLLQHNIKVTALHPGLTETEFSMVRFKGEKEKAKSVYQGYQPLTGMDIANVAHYVTTLPDHVNINDIVVMPTAQANTVHIVKQF